MCRTFYGHLLAILHRTDEAIYQANQALKLDPYRPLVRTLNAKVVAGDPQSAIIYHKRTLAIDSTHRLSKVNLHNAYRRIGNYEKWYEGWRKTTLFDDEIIEKIDEVFHEQGYLDAIEMMAKVHEEAANEKQIQIYGQVWRYLELNQYDKAMDWLEKGYEIHSPSTPYISIRWDQLHDNPRYFKLLKKMNLPMRED